ncbi:hypothetical protein DASC09_056330 [Saccharomycopsis crataegensis]|uniref:Uncharacterized protein n=1 Tax=Saccharomycopsis crataegensis TaxID=43959 RepID=A0AAV5QUV5_9ASCO|nr:hypothetical protein DASC09_056330 [Saccharomycopsis crataegensis]
MDKNKSKRGGKNGRGGGTNNTRGGGRGSSDGRPAGDHSQRNGKYEDIYQPGKSRETAGMGRDFASRGRGNLSRGGRGGLPRGRGGSPRGRGGRGGSPRGGGTSMRSRSPPPGYSSQRNAFSSSKRGGSSPSGFPARGRGGIGGARGSSGQRPSEFGGGRQFSGPKSEKQVYHAFYEYLDLTQLRKVLTDYVSAVEEIFEKNQIRFNQSNVTENFQSYINQEVFTGGFPFEGFREILARFLYKSMSKSKKKKVFDHLEEPSVDIKKVNIVTPHGFELRNLIHRVSNIRPDLIRNYVAKSFIQKQKPGRVAMASRMSINKDVFSPSEFGGGKASNRKRSLASLDTGDHSPNREGDMFSDRYHMSNTPADQRRKSPRIVPDEIIHDPINIKPPKKVGYPVISFDDSFSFLVKEFDFKHAEDTKLEEFFIALRKRIEIIKSDTEKFRVNQDFQGAYFGNLEPDPDFSSHDFVKLDSTGSYRGFTETEREDLYAIPKTSRESINFDDDENAKKKVFEEYFKDGYLESQLQIGDKNLESIKKALCLGSSLYWTCKSLSLFNPNFCFSPIMGSLLKNSFRFTSSKNIVTFYSPVVNLVRSVLKNSNILRYLESKQYRKEFYFKSKIYQEAVSKEFEDTIYLYFNIYAKELKSGMPGAKNCCLLHSIINLPPEVRMSSKFKIVNCVTQKFREMLDFSLLEIAVFNDQMENNWLIDGQKIRLVPIISTSDQTTQDLMFSTTKKQCKICDSFIDGDISCTPYPSDEVQESSDFTPTTSKLKNHFTNKWQAITDPLVLKINQFNVLFNFLSSALDNEGKKLINDIAKSIVCPVEYLYPEDSTRPRKILGNILPPTNLKGQDYDLAIAILPIIVFELKDLVNDEIKAILLMFFEFQMILKKDRYRKSERLYVLNFPHMFFETLRKGLPANNPQNKGFYSTSFHTCYHIAELVQSIGPLAVYEDQGVYEEINFVHQLLISSRFLPQVYNYKLATYNNLKHHDIINWESPASSAKLSKSFFVTAGEHLLEIKNYETDGKLTGNIIDPSKYTLFSGCSSDEKTKQILYATIDSSQEYHLNQITISSAGVGSVFYSSDFIKKDAGKYGNYFSSTQKLMLIRCV